MLCIILYFTQPRKKERESDRQIKSEGESKRVRGAHPLRYLHKDEKSEERGSNFGFKLDLHTE